MSVEPERKPITLEQRIKQLQDDIEKLEKKTRDEKLWADEFHKHKILRYQEHKNRLGDVQMYTKRLIECGDPAAIKEETERQACIDKRQEIIDKFNEFIKIAEDLFKLENSYVEKGAAKTQMDEDNKELDVDYSGRHKRGKQSNLNDVYVRHFKNDDLTKKLMTISQTLQDDIDDFGDKLHKALQAQEAKKATLKPLTKRRFLDARGNKIPEKGKNQTPKPQGGGGKT